MPMIPVLILEKIAVLKLEKKINTISKNKWDATLNDAIQVKSSSQELLIYPQESKQGS